jgi:uncharacterized membrane protein YqaE (UPF0057 family)
MTETNEFNIWFKYLDKSIYIKNMTKNTSSNILYEKIKENISELSHLNCKLLYNGQIIPNDDSHTLDEFGIHEDSTIEIIIPMVGGNVLGDILNAIIQIGEFFSFIPKLIIFIIKLFVWLIQLFLWFLIDFCNPVNLSTDLIGGITKITRLIFAVASDVIFGLIKFGFNKILEPIFSGFWGWDNVLTSEEKKKIVKEQMGNTKPEKCDDKGVKAYKVPDGHIPFSVILGTILLPPMGLFMEFGLTNWINIVICGILTMMYYIPGLIYALVLIYS